MEHSHKPIFRPWLILTICAALGIAPLDIRAQSLPPVFDDPFLSEFQLGMNYKQAEKLVRSGRREGGFREIGSVRLMGIRKPLEDLSANFVANKRTGKITHIAAITNEDLTVEQVIAVLPNYTKSIQIEPGTLMDSTWTRHSNLPSIVLCTSGNQYAVTYQYITHSRFSPFTKVGIVDLAWLEEQLTEFRELNKKMGDTRAKDLRGVCS